MEYILLKQTNKYEYWLKGFCLQNTGQCEVQ